MNVAFPAAFPALALSSHLPSTAHLETLLCSHNCHGIRTSGYPQHLASLSPFLSGTSPLLTQLFIPKALITPLQSALTPEVLSNSFAFRTCENTGVGVSPVEILSRFLPASGFQLSTFNSPIGYSGVLQCRRGSAPALPARSPWQTNSHLSSLSAAPTSANPRSSTASPAHAAPSSRTSPASLATASTAKPNGVATRSKSWTPAASSPTTKPSSPRKSSARRTSPSPKPPCSSSSSIPTPASLRSTRNSPVFFAEPASPSSWPSTKWTLLFRNHSRRNFTRSALPSFPSPPNTARAWTISSTPPSPNSSRKPSPPRRKRRKSRKSPSSADPTSANPLSSTASPAKSVPSSLPSPAPPWTPWTPTSSATAATTASWTLPASAARAKPNSSRKSSAWSWRAAASNAPTSLSSSWTANRASPRAMPPSQATPSSPAVPSSSWSTNGISPWKPRGKPPNSKLLPRRAKQNARASRNRPRKSTAALCSAITKSSSARSSNSSATRPLSSFPQRPASAPTGFSRSLTKSLPPATSAFPRPSSTAGLKASIFSVAPHRRPGPSAFTTSPRQRPLRPRFCSSPIRSSRCISAMSAS